MRVRSVGVPRSENSMHALRFCSGCLMLIRPVSRRMESMLSPCFVIIFVAASICFAERLRPMSVRIYRFLPCWPTHISYWSSVTGSKPICTPSSVVLNSSSFITWPESSSLIRMRMPRERVEWMSAWAMSRIFASLLARISIIDAVRPGRSLPVILIRICSSLMSVFSI